MSSLTPSSWSGWPRRALLAFACGCAPEVEVAPPVTRVTPWVDPFIGTGGPGFRVGSVTPAAGLPFGMVKVGPDTGLDWGGVPSLHCSGYYHDDTHIDGFSHFHMHGTGIADYGSILFMPTDGWDATKTDESGYHQTFSHDNESARPGLYEVVLDDGIEVTLSATEHVAQHRYTYPESVEEPVFLVDLEHVLDGTNLGGEIHIDAEEGTLYGSMLNSGAFSGRYGGFRLYFHAIVEGGFSAWGTWADDAGEAGRADAEGLDLGAWIVPDSRVTNIRVGISLVSVAGARANIEAELPQWDIDGTVARADIAWEHELSKVEIEGGTDEERTIFYTALFHAMQMPNEHSDADGRYRGFDGEIHDGEGRSYYGDFSLWDTYRTAHSLYNLLQPAEASDFATSLLRMAQEGGAFPRWPAAGGDSGCMIGAPADIVLAETWLKGIRDWDMDAAYPLLRAQAMGQGEIPYNARPDVPTLERYGYLPADLFGGSVAWTQELAWADYALAQLAVERGETVDAAHFAWRSHTFLNQWDPAIGFFHARYSDGTFDPSLNEIAWEDEYVEGNAWQYLWMPFPHADAIAAAMGGEEAARARLETFFANAKAEGVILGPQTWYWHGNEPDIHAAWLFTLWGDPDASLKWQRWIRKEMYHVDPDGLAGNDDAGTLSSWYVFSALGFYPIAGTVRYVVGVPLFERATFPVTGGTFEVRRVGDGDHVKAVTLNGLPLDRPAFRHDELVAGGSLVVELE